MKAKTPSVDSAQIPLFSSADGAADGRAGEAAETHSEVARIGSSASTSTLPFPPGEGWREGALRTDAEPAAAPPAAAEILATLTAWADRGWIRRLDAAFARFIAETSAGVAPPALLAIAMAAHMEGEGHACVDLHELVTAPLALLAWKPEPLAALTKLMSSLPRDPGDWAAALRGCAAVMAGEPSANDPQPLVLSHGRLYLRRYWDYERRVADQVLARAAAASAGHEATGPEANGHEAAVDDAAVDDAAVGEAAVDEAAAKRWLDRVFGAPAPGATTDWQKVACAIALRGSITIITGGPGTGKTYTAARLLALLFALAPDRERFRVALAAPTGKAAARLRQSIGSALGGLQERMGEGVALQAFAATLGPAKTLHALLGARPDTRRFRHDAAAPLELDVLVVDEASMVNLEMMAALLDALPAHAHVVLLGDKDQLASVEAGAVLGELCRDAGRGRYTAATARCVAARTGESLPASELDAAGPALAQRTVMLRDSQRFGGAIGALAAAVNAGDAAGASALLAGGGGGTLGWMPAATPAAVVELALHGRGGARGGYRRYLDAIRQRPAAAGTSVDAWARQVLNAFDEFRVLCAVRDGEWGVDGLNRAIEKHLRDSGWLAGAGDWYEGRPVIVGRNDRALGVSNGDVGIALRPVTGAAPLRAYFADGEAVRSVAVSRLADVATAFAMTVHKSQGSEFAHTVLVLPAEIGMVTSRELVYTGITRARTALTLVAGNASALTDAIALSARRSSGLHERLQQPLDGR